MDVNFDHQIDSVYWENDRLSIVLASGEVAFEREFKGAGPARVTDIVRAYQFPLTTLVLHVAVPTCASGGAENLFIWTSADNRAIHSLEPDQRCARYEYLEENDFAMILEGDPVIHRLFWFDGHLDPLPGIEGGFDRRILDQHLDDGLTAMSRSPNQETGVFADAAALADFRAKAGGKAWTFVSEPPLSTTADFRIEAEGQTIGELQATFAFDGPSPAPRIGDLQWRLPDKVITYQLLPGNGWRLTPNAPAVHVGESFMLLRIGYAMNERILTTTANADEILSYDGYRYQDGSFFHAKAAGEVGFSIVPYYGDWAVSTDFILKVEP